MGARLIEAIHWAARWRYSDFVAAGVVIAVLLALGVPAIEAFQWGIIAFVVLIGLQYALLEEKGKWPVVWVILAFALYMVFVLITDA